MKTKYEKQGFNVKFNLSKLHGCLKHVTFKGRLWLLLLWLDGIDSHWFSQTDGLGLLWRKKNRKAEPFLCLFSCSGANPWFSPNQNRFRPHSEILGTMVIEMRPFMGLIASLKKNSFQFENEYIWIFLEHCCHNIYYMQMCIANIYPKAHL